MLDMKKIKKELRKVIEMCDIEGKADKQAKLEACAMWKKVIDYWMCKNMNNPSPVDMCYLRWLKAAITQYEVTTLSRDVFFLYMENIIDVTSYDEYVK